ncbi:hypothetical protein F2Q69_00026630 [Brassica cretica]|uniref:Uncharacterized protein n=1 Tax=Brassica cretica TaxID=69181 RepID=A0A8S9S872_BRACR|nr:hypothetical protein F2Q69_00026630 [Brassica cretica]
MISKIPNRPDIQLLIKLTCKGRKRGEQQGSYSVRVRLYGEMRGVTPVVRGRRWCRSVSVVVGGGERRGSNAGSCHLISWPVVVEEGGCVTSSPMAKHTSSIKRIRDQERDIMGDQRSLDGGGGCLEKKKMYICIIRSRAFSRLRGQNLVLISIADLVTPPVQN